ncbi:polysaccharide deacetylase family protein [Xanthomonas translucens]|uniref:polysaccharide deacetylase family protein n=1 Tax=Xanthomonas campestris pv. translucens TaxID=343 RepID=UPI001F36673E|nr:polysaccharide deacetylase family protein [Xanthomonas translucens]MCS3358884.1 polysaccharide deacetylase family protein [Xanthomonas translucens pv. translucens]MCS3373053.1 polysaccharide deacetylase family protein [Xanthomonas translucens pv. translucens]MCT8277667.1 polysaccharide deacetylase family protein [Xanthomonas translucens pv. translucens]MCT8288449.1 polysaccharide deacetylase family protein [Xanthomonas translucens pv. translucens]MCT8292188.1 polysaccharide deacetylase fami
MLASAPDSVQRCRAARGDRGCKRALEDLLGEPVTQFCYPYGDVDARVAATVQEAGYVAATTTRRGRAVPGSDPWRYPRIQVARHHLLPQTRPGAQ